MQVLLLNKPDLSLVIKAIRICYNSKGDNMGERDTTLLRNIIKNEHTSTLEHCVFTFHISGISRACLQELVRHRIASYSVKSTRYTLKEIINATDLDKFVVGGKGVEALTIVQKYLKEGAPIDQVKYYLPESFKTELIMTINARSLINFFKLRLNKKAFFEIRNLAVKMLEQLKDYKILFEHIEGEKSS